MTMLLGLAHDEAIVNAAWRSVASAPPARTLCRVLIRSVVTYSLPSLGFGNAGLLPSSALRYDLSPTARRIEAEL